MYIVYDKFLDEYKQYSTFHLKYSQCMFSFKPTGLSVKVSAHSACVRFETQRINPCKPSKSVSARWSSFQPALGNVW